MANSSLKTIINLYACKATLSLRVILLIVCLAYILLVILPVVIYLERDGQYKMVNLLIHGYEIRCIPSVPLILAIVGIYGAFHPNYSRLKVFLVFALLAFVVSVTFLVNIHKFEPALWGSEDINRMRNFTNNYDWKGTATSDKDRLFGDAVQYYGNCCGLTSYQDWDLVRPKDIRGNMYPGSCCKLEDGELCPRIEVLDKPSCYHQSKEFLRNMERFTENNLAFLFAMCSLSSFIVYLSSKLSKKLTGLLKPPMKSPLIEAE